MEIPLNAPVPVTLQAMQWDRVMTCLGKMPYENVADLIGGIQGQCMSYGQQLEAAMQPQSGDTTSKVQHLREVPPAPMQEPAPEAG